MIKKTLFQLTIICLGYAINYGQITRDSTYDFSINAGVKYGTAINFKGCVQDLYCDIYKPINTDSQRPIIVLVHGGGFIGGSYRAPEITGLATKMASRGYVVASIQYRMGMQLKSSNPTTSCAFGVINMSPCAYALDSSEFFRAEYRAQQDAKGAIRFMKNRNSLDSSCISNVFLMGHSAGAITCLLAAFLDKPSEKLPFTDSLSAAPSTANICTDNNPCGSTSLLRPALGGIRGTIELTGHDESIKGVFAFAGALPNISMLNNTNDSLLVYTFHQDCDPIVYYKKKALLRDVSSCMVCGGCTPLPLSSEHFGNQSIADSIQANYSSFNLKTDFIYRNKPINCYYGLSGPNSATCPVFTDCSFCANTNYHNCHDIINVKARIDTISNFLFDNISSCNTTSTGITHLSADKSILCYPNPVENLLQIETSNSNLTISKVEILSFSGHSISIHSISENSTYFSIPMGKLPTGVYFIAFQTNQGLVTKKVVKE